MWKVLLLNKLQFDLIGDAGDTVTEYHRYEVKHIFINSISMGKIACLRLHLLSCFSVKV